jgi:phosphate transport system permease protein
VAPRNVPIAPPTSEDTRTLKLTSRSTYLKERFLRYLFLTCAFIAVLAVLFIFVFVGARGWPIFVKVGLFPFLFGTDWAPTAKPPSFGIFPMLFGSFAVMLGALVLGTPLAVGTAIFLSEVASPRVRAIVRPAVELLAGVPSVVYGFFGLLVLRPIIAAMSGTLGFGLLAGWIILAIMIVPTIAALSEDALRSISTGTREASYAMGATTWQTIYKVLVPSARFGILDAVILGMGRAIGETMAVLMVIGNAPVIPASIFAPFSTITTQIVIDMSYATGDHQTALFGMAIVLLVISMAFVAAVRLVARLSGSEEEGS